MSTLRVFSGRAANTENADIVVASIHASRHTFNRLHTALQTGQAIHPQRDAMTASL